MALLVLRQQSGVVVFRLKRDFLACKRILQPCYASSLALSSLLKRRFQSILVTKLSKYVFLRVKTSISLEVRAPAVNFTIFITSIIL